jgi:hypothetical protein
MASDETEGPGEAGDESAAALADIVAAARKTLDQAREAVAAAAEAGDEAIAAEARERPMTALLLALAAGFILGRAL